MRLCLKRETEKLEKYGKLINFMGGLKRRECSSSTRCKTPIDSGMALRQSEFEID